MSREKPRPREDLGRGGHPSPGKSREVLRILRRCPARRFHRKGYEMSRHVDEHFKDTTIRLDGNTYDGCTFTNCTLIYAGTTDDTTVISPRFEHCKWGFEGPAIRT